MDLKAVLLGFLTRGDLTGYELKAAMDESVGFFFGASYGSIYPALRSLEEEGFVRSTLVVQSDRPNKKVYSLTPEGRAYFVAALKEPPAANSFRSEFMVQLFFGRHQDPERLLAMIEDHRSSLRDSLERLRETEKKVREIPQARFGLMCLRYGLSHYENTLAWLDDVEKEVRAIASEGTPAKEVTKKGEANVR
ncbi:MAG: PadR family transcriptional regulator [Actinobacteria bacterium]|nr:PadR family transcriptional regulator [Actinomycetota bacterium]